MAPECSYTYVYYLTKGIEISHVLRDDVDLKEVHAVKCILMEKYCECGLTCHQHCLFAWAYIQNERGCFH